MPNRSTSFSIRTTAAVDAEPLRALRLEALAAYPLAFTADLKTTQARPMDWWRDLAAGTGESTVFVADTGSAGLVGMLGILVPAQPKLRHAGVVWGVYVRPDARRQGIGDALMAAAVQWAREHKLVTLRLSVTQGNGAAERSYQRAGFVAYGVEPLAVQWQGQFYDEILMVRRLHCDRDRVSNLVAPLASDRYLS